MGELLIGMAILISVCFVGYIIIYNKFKRLVIEVEETSSGIDVALAKRYDLITNLVESVKGYVKHEKEVFEKVASIRNLLKSNRTEAKEEMDQSLGRIMMLVEAYPELKADHQFLELQKSLVDVEEHLQAARRLYNRKVAELNIKIHQFPTNMIASSMGVEEKAFFSASDEQKGNVEVNI